MASVGTGYDSVLKLPGEQFIEWGGAQRWWRRTHGSPAAVRDAAARAGGHAT